MKPKLTNVKYKKLLQNDNMNIIFILSFCVFVTICLYTKYTTKPTKRQKLNKLHKFYSLISNK